MVTENTIPEEYKNHISPEKDWKEIVAWVSDLPPLPHVAAQALTLIEDPDTTAGKLTQLLGQDAALAARVLKIANSAMFSRQREISTINQAIMTIGFKTLKGIIVAATLRQLNKKIGPVENMIWVNSTSTSISARILATQLKKAYIEEVFLFGLLHDLGKLVLMRQIPKNMKLFLKRQAKVTHSTNLNKKTFGFAHPLIGALVAKKWNFSSDTCQVILHHHDALPEKIENELQEKTLLINFADALSHSLGHGHEEGYPDNSEHIKKLSKLFGLSDSETETLKGKIGEMFADIGSAFM